MIIEYKFKTQSGETVEGMRTELDRNYGDEETALVFIDRDCEVVDNGYFELNVRKDAEGHLLPEGYVAYYADTDQTMPEYLINDVELHTTEHDFDETLARANETLLPYGMEIVLEYDGELYWAIASRRKDGGDEQWFVDADFAHEVSGHINECLAHVLARVKNPELVKTQENTMDAMRRLWEGLSGEQQVDLMTEFYYQLMDAEKDRFLRETGNE